MSKKTSLQFHWVDYMILFGALACSLFSWIYTGIHYENLPDQIPSHYNFNGEADGYSGKEILFYISGIFTVLMVGVYFLARSKNMHNIQLKTHSANFRSIAIFMPFLGIIQSIAIYTMIGDANQTFGYSSWVLPSILSVTLVFIFLMFAIIHKNKKS